MAGKGGDGCCTGCAKWLLIIFNIVFCLIGIALLAAGIYAYIELKDYLAILGTSAANAPAIVIIVLGCITFIIAAIGCVGACKESPCLLFTFAIIIAILVIAEVATGIVAFVYQDQISAWFSETAPELMKTYKEGEDTATTDTWDFIQIELGCCGVNSWEEWNDNETAPEQAANGPPASCGTDYMDRPNCHDAIVKFISNNIVIVGGCAIAFGIIELLGIVFACCVGCNARKGESA